MKYFIKRDLNEYGPYTLADLQRYVAAGNILLTDLTRSEGITDWVPVSQVLGNIPVPVPAPTGAVYSGAPGSPGYVGGYGVAAAPSPDTPMPPDFHWALVLLINYFCGFFHIVWLFVEAAFIKKIVPGSKGVLLLSLGLGGIVLGVIVAVIGSESMDEGTRGSFAAVLGVALIIAGIVVIIAATFTMRSDLEEYYNTTENINLRLSGVGSTLLTFFFAVYYFQWHFSRIAKWKKTGVLTPQGG